MSPPSPDDLSRRRFVRVGGGTALALVIGGAAGIIDRSGDETDSSTPPSTTSAPIPELGEVDPAITALGQRVAEIRDLTDPVTVLAMLDLAGATSAADPLEQAAQMVRDDFAARRTIEIDGWVLAESEANAAAVVFLLCREDGAC